METLNIISDNGKGFIVRSAGFPPTAEQMKEISNSEWVESELSRTEAAALDPSYPALNAVLEYRAAIRAWRDANYEGDRPCLNV